jgi:hypothetical protein
MAGTTANLSSKLHARNRSAATLTGRCIARLPAATQCAAMGTAALVRATQQNCDPTCSGLCCRQGYQVGGGQGSSWISWKQQPLPDQLQGGLSGICTLATRSPWDIPSGQRCTSASSPAHGVHVHLRTDSQTCKMRPHWPPRPTKVCKQHSRRVGSGAELP